MASARQPYDVCRMTIQPAPSRESFQQRTADLRRIGVRDVGAACGPRRAAPAAARIGRVRRTCRDRVAQSSPAWQPVAFVHLDNNAATGDGEEALNCTH